MTRGLATLLLALALLTPCLAVASDGYGTITLLKERRAGFLEEVTRSRAAVVVVRAGVELVAERGLEVQDGDTIRTGRGAAVVTTPQGWTVAVGEDSEVTLGPSLYERVGTLLLKVKGAFSVRTDEVEVLVEGTRFVVQRRDDGGRVAVTEGAVSLRPAAGGASVRLPAPSTLAFSGAAIGGPEPLVGAAAREIARLDRQIAQAAPRSWARRLTLRVGGGGGSQQDRGWGRVEIGVGLRLLGPLWLQIDGGLQARPVAVQEGGAELIRQALAIPVTVSGQLLLDLPGGGFVHAGPALTMLVGERCIDVTDCTRAVEVEPGFALDAGLGIFLGPVVGLDLRVRAGIDRRRRFREVTVGDPSEGPGLQAVATAGLRVRL